MRNLLLFLIHYIYIGVFFVSSFTTAQERQRTGFRPPFDFPITFSGNFGEIRANHFHGGLDFKTGGVSGKEVHALADGYISRIRVTHGSGYVLDVVYENGFSTINRHLSAFVSPIAERVEALQYERESWEVEICPEPGEYPVRAGQVIALSGNTGYSFGPHLHLDVFETESGDYIDPLPFFKDKVKDHTAPRAEGIALFPRENLGTVNGKQTVQTFALTGQKVPEVWGVIGVGIKAYDYMDGVRNRYGVKNVVLEVDGQEVFRSVVDRFSESENRYINSWTYGQYMKSFREPGNGLRLLQATDSREGWITVDEERPYRLTYILTDALGNTSRVNFTLQGRRTEIVANRHEEEQLFRWNRMNYLQLPGMQLFVPRNLLYDDTWVGYTFSADSNDVAYTYRLRGEKIPLHRACDLCIALRRRPVEDMSKYYVATFNKRGEKYGIGGRYEEGMMKVRVRELASFTVAVDTVPPELIPVDERQWGRTGRIVFKAKDKETGIASYRGTIDGKYALFGKPNSISGNLVCELDARHVRKGGRHLLVMTVTDGCGNERTEQYEFTW